MTDGDRIASLQRHDPVGVILAGGESRRMGRDKALLRPDGGETLLERTVARLRDAGVGTVALSLSTAQRATAMREATPALAALPVVVDTQPGLGPLGGLHAALAAFSGRHVVLVACDMPYLSVELTRLLLGAPYADDIVVPRSAGRIQCLHARYSPACLPVAARLIAAGRLAMRDLLTGSDGWPHALRVRVLDEETLARHGIAATAFDNLNTPVDLAALRTAHG